MNVWRPEALLPTFPTWPLLRKLHNDRRWQLFLDKMGFKAARENSD